MALDVRGKIQMKIALNPCMQNHGIVYVVKEVFHLIRLSESKTCVRRSETLTHVVSVCSGHIPFAP